MYVYSLYVIKIIYTVPLSVYISHAPLPKVLRLICKHNLIPPPMIFGLGYKKYRLGLRLLVGLGPGTRYMSTLLATDCSY